MELLIRQKFRQKIREQAYDFLFVKNGKEALEILTQNPDVSVVLSDINMPKMDGLSLLTGLADSFPHVKTVMVSAYGDMENIRTAMNRGAFDFVTKPVNFEDLRVTVEKTIRHVEHLNQSRKTALENRILKMYVDEHVLREVEDPDGEEAMPSNKTVEATVAFIDICGFTAISEHEKPDAVITLLNRYFDVMVQEIIAQKGTVDKFIGDCLMAVFRGDFHLDRALDACLAIRTKIEEMPNENSYAPKVSIGINSGEMISGNIGSVALKRLDYTVIGDVVNTAQRLQSAAQPGQVVISEACYEQVKTSFQCRELGTFQLKNKTGELRLFEVIS